VQATYGCRPTLPNAKRMLMEVSNGYYQRLHYCSNQNDQAVRRVDHAEHPGRSGRSIPTLGKGLCV